MGNAHHALSLDQLGSLCDSRPGSPIQVDPPEAADMAEGMDVAQQIRMEHTPSSCLLHYKDEPLKVVRGQGQFLYDKDNVAYLDCVNNHSHVGHCHPKIISAALSQMTSLGPILSSFSELPGIVDEYIQELQTTFPPELNTFYFTNSGSEGVDLALQLARSHTGGHDVMVVDGAFHGANGLGAYCSPQQWKHPRMEKKDWVHVIPCPNVYRGVHRDAEAANKYLTESERVIQRVVASGRKIAAALVESVFSVQGIVVPPKGWLMGIANAVRTSGGLLVVDEVNTGFGRCGSGGYWSYQLHGVVPDIVVLGKPIGNGYPMGVVVTTTAIGRSFPESMNLQEYRGNPLAAAVGVAVLSVLRTENMLHVARKVGQLLMDSLRALAQKHSCLGDVRGAGMMIGIEVVYDKRTRKPDPALAERILYRLKDEEHVIVGLEGDFKSVLLLLPPLCFTPQDVRRLIEAMDRILSRGPPEPEEEVTLAMASTSYQPLQSPAEEEEQRYSDMD